MKHPPPTPKNKKQKKRGTKLWYRSQRDLLCLGWKQTSTPRHDDVNRKDTILSETWRDKTLVVFWASSIHHQLFQKKKKKGWLGWVLSLDDSICSQLQTCVCECKSELWVQVHFHRHTTGYARFRTPSCQFQLNCNSVVFLLLFFLFVVLLSSFTCHITFTSYLNTGQ